MQALIEEIKNTVISGKHTEIEILVENAIQSVVD